ncbi:MAG: MurR/RpiR family transcriptional regulator [Sarcina sp.]
MLINKINEILNTSYANDTYQSIGRYIKDNINEIPKLSIEEIANSCFVSKSMITKFTKKLGFESFKDFKYECEEHSRAIETMPNIKYKTNTLRENVVEMMDSVNNAFRNAANELDYKSLEIFIEDIKNCSSVIAIGNGSSKNVCESLQFYFDYIKKPVYIADVDFKREIDIDENAIIILISANGNMIKYNKRTIRKVNELKQKKWLITCNEDVKEIENTIVIPSKEAAINDILTIFMVKVIVSKLREEKE